MRILVTGACGFVGSSLLSCIRQSYDHSTVQLVGVDNLARPGSYLNVQQLRKMDVEFLHADVRQTSDFEGIARCDWIIDAAANASVLAGTQVNSSRALVETNLLGTLNSLELCKRWSAGFILLSSSRVYSLNALTALPLVCVADAYGLDLTKSLPQGVSAKGFDESFSNAAPLSLYGVTKLASEQLALEYAMAFDFPVWINRCGVMAGAGQFGKADQGIFSYWLHSWLRKRPLSYIGFGGLGYQVRDCLHPQDLFNLIYRQINVARPVECVPIANVSGGIESAISLKQLSNWCARRWGHHPVDSCSNGRQYDVPWLVLDSSAAKQKWNWQPERAVESILEEIAQFAEENPHWLDIV